MDNINPERIIANVNATMAMEGMPLTDEDKARLRLCLNGEKSFEETVAELVKIYQR
ncbi:MAG: antitoxin VbhA family protein [Oscillospiraceae bacterium]|nr:antitoxin VbhA family protein [Oscillospiraceae bacterium]